MYTRASTEASADFRRISFRFDAGSSSKVIACWIPVASRTPRTPTTHGRQHLHSQTVGAFTDVFCEVVVLGLFPLVRRMEALLCLLLVHADT